MMKKALVIVWMLITTVTAFSQFFENAVSIELRYPVPAGNNFMSRNSITGKGYTGILDAGIEYSIYKADHLSAGISFNTSILQLKEVELTATGFLPKIYASYDFRTGNLSFIPQVAFGYARWRFKGPDIDFTDDNGNPVHIENKTVDNGWSAEGSVKMLYRTGSPVNWFLQFSYGFTRLEKPSFGENSDYNRNISMIYPGLGLMWRF